MLGRPIGHREGRLNTNPLAVTNAKGHPPKFRRTADHVIGQPRVAGLLGRPPADWMIADRRRYANWFREDLQNQERRLWIPGRRREAR
jgi:hypothetical protein